MNSSNPYHNGEIAVQELVGQQHIANMIGKLINNSISRNFFEFIQKQSIFWVGVEAEDGKMLAFPIFGSPGFIRPYEGKQLVISLVEPFSLPDEWRELLKSGKAIGGLLIDFFSRFRLRINGMISIIDECLVIDVKQVYPNCPKYIRKRVLKNLPLSQEAKLHSVGTKLNIKTQEIIEQADTAFVISSSTNGADLSHRGGSSGFIKHQSNNQIVVPDYKGNSMFNTLGNFKTNPNGGVLIVDFDQGCLLQITGEVKLIFDNQGEELKTGGTNRYWTLDIKYWQLFKLESKFECKNLDFSQFNP